MWAITSKTRDEDRWLEQEETEATETKDLQALGREPYTGLSSVSSVSSCSKGLSPCPLRPSV